MNTSELSQLIRSRRSVYPHQFNGKSISAEVLEECLENAHWAPNHKLTEPWRFKVMRNEKKDEFAEFFAETYKRVTPEDQFLEAKFEKLKSKVNQSACVVAVYFHRDPMERLPEWEELSAVSMAVQNFWLTAAAHGIGMYWASPGLIHHVDDFFEPANNEKCLGFLFIGYHDKPGQKPRKGELQDKVTWMD